MNLKQKLLHAKKTRWLDVGCGDNFEEGFYYLDYYLPKEIVKEEFKQKYTCLDILNASETVLESMEKFDFIRLQHVLEHFTYEEGTQVLINCTALLNSKGLLLITTPDLRIHLNRYLTKTYSAWDSYKPWAHRRIPKNSPQSFYFSIFAHSMLQEGNQHKWCYDSEGLKYQMENVFELVDIQEITLQDSLAIIPFTHNRPEEDVCIIATKL